MKTAETTAILDAAQKLFGFSKAELEKLADDPEQPVVLADIVKASQ